MSQKLVGVISDTHSLMRDEAIDILRGTDLIIHAGDVGGIGILQALRNLAPLYAVRGNTDRGEYSRELPEKRFVEVGGLKLFVLHDLADMNFNPVEKDVSIVISGHTHQPHAVRKNGVLYLNPGSAGPRRYGLPVSLARLHIQGPQCREEYFELDV